MASAAEVSDKVIPAGSGLGVHHDTQTSIEPWIGKIGDLSPAFGDGQIGNGCIDFALGNGPHQRAVVLKFHIMRCNIQAFSDVLPDVNRHAGVTIALIVDERFADINANLHRLWGLCRPLRISSSANRHQGRNERKNIYNSII